MGKKRRHGGGSDTRRGGPACNSCGLCCVGSCQPGIKVTLPDIIRILRYLKDDPERFGDHDPDGYFRKYFSFERFSHSEEFCIRLKEDARFRPEKCCIFLNEDYRCDIHPARPWPCVILECSLHIRGQPLESVKHDYALCYMSAWKRFPALTAQEVVWNFKALMSEAVNQQYLQNEGNRFDYKKAVRYLDDPEVEARARLRAFQSFPDRYQRVYDRQLKRRMNLLQI